VVEAKAALEAVHAQGPDLAGAAYDLGVIGEAFSDWEAAEGSLAPPRSAAHREALNSVRKRLGSAQSGFPP
jgi:hypothetical protein